MPESNIWIPPAIKSKSALRKELRVPQNETIPVGTLNDIKRTEPGGYTSTKKHDKKLLIFG